MSCLGVVVRLNSFRGFNLAHISAVMGTIGVVFGNSVPARMEVGPLFSFGPRMWTLIRRDVHVRKH